MAKVQFSYNNSKIGSLIFNNNNESKLVCFRPAKFAAYKATKSTVGLANILEQLLHGVVT